MKRILTITAVLTLGISLLYAGPDKEPLKISASIAPMAYVAKVIGGDLVTVDYLIPESASPEVYSPTPRQIVNLVKSDMYLQVGHPGFLFERIHLAPVLKNHPEITVLSGFEGDIDTPKNDMEEHNHRHEGDEDDPHLWLNPDFIRSTASIITKHLVSVDAENYQTYQQNLISFLSEVDALDSETRQIFSDLSKHTFMVFHPVWGHYAGYYNLEQIALEKDGKEPGPVRIVNLVNTARKKQIDTIFIQKGFSHNSVELIAAETNSKIVELNPLAYDWIANLRQVSYLLRDALNG